MRWKGFRSSSTSPSAGSASADRRRIAAAALVPVALLAAAVGAIVGAGGDPVPRAARLAPPDALLWVHTGDEARLSELAGRFPSLRAARGRLLGDDDWIGDEAALALPGEGPPLLLAEVGDRAAAERFAARLTAGGDGSSGGGAATLSAAFAGDFLAVGSRDEVRAALDRARGAAAALAGSAAYRRARAEHDDDAVVEAYAPAAGVRRLLGDAPAAVRAPAGFADSPHFEALTAHAVRDDGGLRIVARVHRAAGAPPAEEFAPALLGRVPETAAAYLALPGADALAGLLSRTAAGATLDVVRAALPDIAGLDLDRDVLGPLGTEAGVTIMAARTAPVVTLTARTADPELTREALARLQAPLVERLAPGAAFEAREGGAFSLPVTARLQPSYAVAGGVLVASTAEPGLEQLRAASRGVAQELAVQAVMGDTGGRVEALGFVDLRQLLALGERTGLTGGPGFPAVRDDLLQVRAAGAVVRREESDSTAELFLEIP